MWFKKKPDQVPAQEKVVVYETETTNPRRFQVEVRLRSGWYGSDGAQFDTLAEAKSHADTYAKLYPGEKMRVIDRGEE